MSVVISGARKVDADGIVEDFWLLIDGESIAATGTGAPPAAERIDAQGDWLAPGFIDLHGHGGGGHRFDDGAVAATARALGMHRTQLRRLLERHAIAAPADSEQE